LSSGVFLGGNLVVKLHAKAFYGMFYVMGYIVLS
jgi:hypothetical protein